MGYVQHNIAKVAILKSTQKGLARVIPFLNSRPDVMILTSSSCIDHFLEQTAGIDCPDIILVEEPGDYSHNSVSRLTILHQKFPQSAILYFTVEQGVEHVLWAIHAGASGYIPSGTKPKFFQQEFDRFIREGGLMVPPLQLLQILLSSFPHRYQDYLNYHLSAAEICIVEKIKRGYTPESIAISQHQDIHLIRKHLKHIFSKVDLQNCLSVENRNALPLTGD